jgi:S-adenosylmethionine hydrolase
MPIALLTDFGTSDSYAGVLKGVISRIAPSTPVIDLSHEIPPFDVVQGALVLYQAFHYFPEKTIFVGVVDPGVGGLRRPMLIQTKRYFFIGPDNGLFSLALSEEEVQQIIQLNNCDYFLKSPSHTFHGRDIFAPVAAHLSSGVAPIEFGPQVSGYEKLKDLEPQKEKDEIIGKILSIDRFGNAITNLRLPFLQEQLPNLSFSAEIGGKVLRELKTHYAEGESKEAFLLFGSTGLLEISVNQGSAAETLHLKRGDPIKIKP